MALQRLREAAEKAKIELSNLQETTMNLPFLTATAGGPVHLDLSLTRSRLEQMIQRVEPPTSTTSAIWATVFLLSASAFFTGSIVRSTSGLTTA